MIEVEIITPSEVVERAQAKMVVVPALEGDIGVLRNHVPFSSPLRPGLLKLYDQDDHVKKTMLVANGFVNVVAEKCSILAEIIDPEWEKANRQEISERIDYLTKDLADPKDTDDVDQMKADLALMKLYKDLLKK